MQKIVNLLDVGFTRLRKDLRARGNLAFRRGAVEAYYAQRYAVPERLYVECTNVCNARRVFCYYPKVADSLPRKYMDVGEFRRILQEFKAAGGNEVGLTPTVGDPFIDLHFAERVRILDEIGLPAFLYTNLIQVSGKIERALREASGFRFTVNVSWGGLVEADIDQAGDLEKKARPTRVGPCQISYIKPLVTVDLKLKPCDCRDVKDELIVGDLKTQSLAEIWTGPEANRIRASMYDPAKMPDICRKCEMYVSIYDYKGEKVPA